MVFTTPSQQWREQTHNFSYLKKTNYDKKVPFFRVASFYRSRSWIRFSAWSLFFLLPNSSSGFSLFPTWRSLRAHNRKPLSTSCKYVLLSGACCMSFFFFFFSLSLSLSLSLFCVLFESLVKMSKNCALFHGWMGEKEIEVDFPRSRPMFVF